MTPRQSQALSFIREFWAEKGYSPSYDEIRESLGLKSKSGVWFLLNALQDQGYVARTFNKVRSVTPIEISPSAPTSPPPAPEATEKTAKTPWG
jgi:repressor LexA